MRTIVNISLPSQLSQTLEDIINTGRFASKSEFFRFLLRDWVEENEIVQQIKESRRQLRAGKGKLLKSLKDLR